MLRLILGLLMVLEQVNAQEPMTDRQAEERQQTEEQLDWKREGVYGLPYSNSTLNLPKGRIALFGKDAETMHTLSSGMPDTIDAMTCTDDDTETVIFRYYPEGYVSIDDWNELNPKELLQSYIENTERNNKTRRSKGLEELHVLGWIQEPFLDKKSHTVYWALEAVTNENEHFINSFALRLGRFGYEELVWLTDKAGYIPFGGELDVMLKAHRFNQGFRYSDYIRGDKLAAYGIASLVAASIGVKVLKTGTLLLLLKKFGAAFLALGCALFYKIKSFFQKGDCE